MTSPTRTPHRPVARRGSAPAARRGSAPAARRGPARTVIVDDSPDFLWLLGLLLAKDDAVEVVAEAADGAEGLHAVERHEPDLVITDLQMPGLDGMALTRAVRRIHPEIPIILLTALQGPKIVAEAADAGVSRYLAKGGDLTTLIPEVLRELEGCALL